MVTSIETQAQSSVERKADWLALKDKEVNLASRAVERGSGPSIFHAAGRTAVFFDHLRAHYRETRRTEVEIPIDIKIRLANGTLFDSGTATILNISPSGALLANFKLANRHIPLGKFKLELILRGGDYEGIAIDAKPVRFDENSGGLGIKFEEICVAV